MIRKTALRALKRSLDPQRVHRLRLALGRANNRLWTIARPKSLDSRLHAAVLCEHVRSRLREFEPRFDDDRINQAFRGPAASERVEYLYHVREPCAIEPRFGFVILPPAGIVWQSVGQTGYTRFPDHCTDLGCVPSFMDYLARSKTTVLREPRVALIRNLHENNYWHFIHDILGRAAFLAEHGVPDDVPLVVGSNLYDAAFFQQALARGLFAGRRVIRQDSFYIHADEVVFCAPFPHERSRFESALSRLNAPSPQPQSLRRIYLTRARSRGRFIENEHEIHRLCQEFGFEPVDTDNLSLAEQMELFASIGYLIGIHGAGLANMIYRRDAPMSLLEIFDPGHIAPHYFWLAKDFGHDYDAVVGETSVGTLGGFRVDPALLRQKITRLLDT